LRGQAPSSRFDGIFRALPDRGGDRVAVGGSESDENAVRCQKKRGLPRYTGRRLCGRSVVDAPSWATPHRWVRAGTCVVGALLSALVTRARPIVREPRSVMDSAKAPRAAEGAKQEW
jgi:hypothetical protein